MYDQPLLRYFDKLVKKHKIKPLIDDGFYFRVEDEIKRDVIVNYSDLIHRFLQYDIIRRIESE